MKIALLLCDHVNDNLRHLQGDYDDMFRALFTFPGDSRRAVNFHVFDVSEGHFPANAAAFDAYFVNGSRHSVYDDIGWILTLKKFVREIHVAGKKYVGVCFGHQLLAEALGGQVAKAAIGWTVGVHEFEILRSEKWMQPPAQKLNLLMMCQDQVQALPPRSTVLARTAACPVGMFRVGENMLGIQAHPEFSKAYDQALMELRRERMGETVVQAGIESLAKPTQQDVVAQWVLNFLTLIPK